MTIMRGQQWRRRRQSIGPQFRAAPVRLPKWARGEQRAGALKSKYIFRTNRASQLWLPVVVAAAVPVVAVNPAPSGGSSEISAKRGGGPSGYLATWRAHCWREMSTRRRSIPEALRQMDWPARECRPQCHAAIWDTLAPAAINLGPISSVASAGGPGGREMSDREIFGDWLARAEEGDRSNSFACCSHCLLMLFVSRLRLIHILEPAAGSSHLCPPPLPPPPAGLSDWNPPASLLANGST